MLLITFLKFKHAETNTESYIELYARSYIIKNILILDVIPYNIGFVNYRSRHTIIKKNTSIPTYEKKIKFHVNTDNNFTCEFKIYYWNEESLGNENLIKKYDPINVNFFRDDNSRYSYFLLNFYINENGILEILTTDKYKREVPIQCAH
jgi:molecular chaperone DnaK (HSP70)